MLKFVAAKLSNVFYLRHSLQGVERIFLPRLFQINLCRWIVRSLFKKFNANFILSVIVWITIFALVSPYTTRPEDKKFKKNRIWQTEGSRIKYCGNSSQLECVELLVGVMQFIRVISHYYVSLLSFAWDPLASFIPLYTLYFVCIILLTETFAGKPTVFDTRYL